MEPPKHSLPDTHSLTVSVYIRIHSNVDNCENKNKMRIHAEYNKKKWWQPWFQLHLVTKSHFRHELGLPTLSAAVHQKWCCIWCSDLFKLFMNSKFTKRFHFSLCADRHSFYYFHLLTLNYIPWAPSFWLWLCTNLRLAACIFHTTDMKYVMFCAGWRKSLKGSETP